MTKGCGHPRVGSTKGRECGFGTELQECGNALWRFGFPFFSMVPLAPFGSVAYLSLGYDEEFFNILMIEGQGGLIGKIRSHDVPPPDASLANRELRKLVGGDWHLVRLFIGLFAVACCFTRWVSCGAATETSRGFWPPISPEAPGCLSIH